MGAIFGFFKQRWVLVTLGFLLLFLFIWYAGPYFAFADWRPLGSVLARAMAFALCVLLWLAAAVWKRFRAGSASDKLLHAVAKQDPGKVPSADIAKLRERFEEAAALLKKGRRGGQSLYDLPWYVIIGAAGSGKTTALINSGRHMPLAQRFGKEGLGGVGGTRNCDWWFTDEAVFLDTAGRYTTQDSDAASDSEGWKEFLALLSKYRKRRPVNGIVLTISTHDLMTQGDAERDAHVE